MATKTDIELKIVDSVDTSHTEAEVLTDSASNPDAFYVGRGYLAHNGEKVIEGIDPNGSYPNMSVGNAQKAKEAEKATHADTATDLSGRVEATPEVFTYRPSAGEKSIKDDNAFIRRVKGNSVVWNQLVDNNTLFIGEKNGMVISKNEDGSITFNGTASSAFTYNLANVSIPVGHKIALMGMDNMSPFVFYINGGIGRVLTSSGILTCSSTGATGVMFLYINANTTFNNVTIKPKIHYLTRMFGAGDEPTTVEEFRALYPDSYYPYNAGELCNLVCSGIKTVGFNQWDEQWESGTINGGTGVNSNDTQNIRSANYIPALPDMEYYFHCGTTCTVTICCYDSAYNFLGSIAWGSPINRKYKTPPNTSYIRFATYTLSEIGYGPTYNNDICINLSHTGVRDGDYEPYKEVTHSLPLSQVTNGEPLRKAGSVYDEINETHYIKRVGVVDLGSLTYRKSDNYPNLFISNPFGTAGADADKIANLFCPKYITMTARDPWRDIISMGMDTSKQLYIYDPQYTDIATFKSAMSGVMLNYELAEPIVTPITTPIDFNYYVEDFGTEKALLAEDSAPFSADIVYQFNATDQIRNNSRNIDKLQKSAFTPSGTSSQYIRGDGSYGNRMELSQSTPINDGEYEMPDEGDYDMQFILTPNYYAKSPRELDDTTTIAVFVTAPEDSNYLAEYWFEFAVGEALPNIEYYQPNNSDAVFRIDGNMMTYAINILHLISSDGGETFFGEIKNYVL